MKTWAGVGIAVVALIATLWLQPAMIFGFETSELKIAFAGVLLALAGLVFFLGFRMEEVNLPRQITIWSAGLLVIAIGATNMDILTGATKVFKPVAKVKKPYIPRSQRTKNSTPTAIYVPDTLKINRVERLVEPEQNLLNPLQNSEALFPIPTLTSKQDTALDKDWQPTEAQKQQFKRFLEARGLKYDPETAFKRPGSEKTQSKPTNTNPKAAKGDAFSSFN